MRHRHIYILFVYVFEIIEPEECTEERNENNGNTRQYIEVFDNVYVPESSETASNDPDIDAEDDVSDIGGTANIISQDSAMDNNSTTNFMTRSAVGPIVGQQISSTTGFMTSERNSSEHSFLSSTNNSENSNTITCGISPYLSFVETDEHLNYRQTGDISVNALPVVESSSYRREGTRRLVFLDQQYCTQMPTFSNATEEGQIETFNQDGNYVFSRHKFAIFFSITFVCNIVFVYLKLSSTASNFYTISIKTDFALIEHIENFRLTICFCGNN